MSRRVVATILGCGSSGGVPRIGNQWGACDPDNPRNRRRRCSLLVEAFGAQGATRILIDTGCDLREQLLDAGVETIDAVFYTHEHADHTHGIDDLRVLAINARRRVEVYFSQEAANRIVSAFAYCFTAAPGADYPPILNQNIIEPGESATIRGAGGPLTVTAFRQVHGNIDSLGFRIGDFAYSCDLSGIPEDSARAVSGLSTWVLDALRPTPHPSHLSLPESLALIARYRPKQAVLTNLHIDMDYETLAGTVPDGVAPAYDGMRIAIEKA
jgi:phosphoribosyl 1,2-cyclic phosphate phosphodiesterase